MAMIDGGELVARTLVAAGVTHAFGIHGGHLDSMLSAMARHGITLIDTRHEAAAGHAAEAWSRTTGQVGVCFVTSGPGFTNGYTPLASAHLDRVPLLMLTSSPPLREAELNVLQGGVDQIQAAAPVTRWAHRVSTTARIPDLVTSALRRTQAPTPGPVVLELPIDVLFRTVDEELASPPGPTTVGVPGPSVAAVAAVVDRLHAAERPLLVVGGGAARSAGASAALTALLDHAPMPVVASTWGHGVLDPDHPCWLGGLYELAALPFLAGAPDLVVLLGARRGFFLSRRMVPDGVDVVQVDLDGGEPGRLPVDLGVTSDVGELLRALAGPLQSRALPDRSAWIEATRAARDGFGLLFAEAPPVTPSGRIHPYVAAREVAGALDPDGILVFDGGESSGWISAFARASRPGSWFGNGYFGGLGVGPGFAVGAQAAHPDRPVVLYSGDGAIGFNLVEWDTMVRHGLPITTVVSNNLGWGMSFHGQEALFGADGHVVSDLPETRYDRIAESFGLYGERVEDPDEIGPAMRRARDSGRPACIDIAVAPEVVHPMMADMVGNIPEGYTPMPYYEPIPPGEV